tara:strand:- start:2225 stop:2386 length:162 start_codon:yes stop_codon:yes gene_type:complete
MANIIRTFNLPNIEDSLIYNIISSETTDVLESLKEEYNEEEYKYLIEQIKKYK